MYLVAYCRTVLMVFIESLNIKRQKMKNALHNIVLASSFLISSLAYSQAAPPTIADEVALFVSSKQINARPYTIKHAGAEFIKVHFKKLDLPKGAKIKLTSADGSESIEYTQSQKAWFAQSIFGDEVTVKLIPNKKGEKGHYEIDYFTAGSDTILDDFSSFSTCGENERRDVACWQDSHPEKVAWSQPVARLLINGRGLCTAWRVGPDNKMFTNNHCVESQSELSNTEVWFNYQRSSCNGSMSTTVKVMGNELLSTDYTLDYTLFTVHDFEKIASFGYLGLDASEPVFGNGIYIPQHGSGNPKELSIESDKNGSGMCQIDVASTGGRGSETDTGYFCDTIGGSSGSPVLNTSNNKAIALHHFGGCENQGVKISKIWPEVASFFDNNLPDGNVNPPTPGPGLPELEVDVPVADLQLSRLETAMYVVKAENRNAPIKITISSGTGDADLYVRSGSEPTTTTYDCRPYKSGNNETCSVPAKNEDLYVMVRAYSSFSGVTLMAKKQ